MAYSYKGSISFGLVYIPVTLHSTIRDNDIGFNMIDKKTMSRVKYKKTCADCDGREVKQEDIVKGFEYEDGKYVIFEEKDFEKIVSIKSVITKCLNYAEDHKYIAYTPAARLKIPKTKKPKIPTRSAPHYFIKPEIMQKIFERFPERTPSHIPLKIGYECGLRLGEVFGLCWEDVDFKNKVIYINRQVQWLQDKKRTTIDKVSKNGSAECGNGYWYFCPPKYNSYRTIEISDRLADLLFQEQARQSRAKDFYNPYYTEYDVEKPLTFNGIAPKNPTVINRISTSGEGYPVHLICVRDNGTFISPRTMQHVTKCVKKEITEQFDFHSLRKTHASMLNEIGIDQKYIQTRLGHSDIDITVNVYECVTDLMRIRGRNALNTMFSRI